MKNFKTLLLALITLVTLASCSNDDSGIVRLPVPPGTVIPPVVVDPPVVLDSIIGEWRIDVMYFDGDDVKLNDCERKAVVIFEKENILNEAAVDYDCTIITDDRHGTWEKGDVSGDYKIRTNADSFNAFYNDVEFTQVAFDGDTMTTTCVITNQGPRPYTLALKYVKVKSK